MADQVQYLQTDEEITFDANGKVVEKIRIRWKLGDHGPFIARFPKDTFSASSAKLEIERQAAEFRQLS